MRPSHRVVLVLTLAMTALACSARTTLNSVWSAQDMAVSPVSSLLILGIGTQQTSRRIFEDHFSQALEARQTSALASYRVLPADAKISKAELEQALKDGGFDGLVVTRLLAVDETQTYVPPTSSMSMGMGRGYYGYYGSSWGANYSPGYVQTTTIVRLETRLYDARHDKLVWSAQSDTFQPSDTEDTVASVTKAVVAQMVEDGWIR